MKNLEKENKELKQELARIKDGIKQCQVTMIIDGNDMCDWGWLTIEDVNKTCIKRWGKGISQY